jgi:hypothetical protein
MLRQKGIAYSKYCFPNQESYITTNMDRRLQVEDDITPSDEWLQSLNATCNRLSTQYWTLLKAGSSVMALQSSHNKNDGVDSASNSSGNPQQHDPRGK